MPLHSSPTSTSVHSIAHSSGASLADPPPPPNLPRLQAPLLLQASAATALLEHSMDVSQQQPWQPLPLLSVAFVTQQLEQRQRGASAAAADDLAAAHAQLMQQALLQLQRLGERQAAAQKAGTAPAALVRTGTAGCYRLLRSLQQHMPAADFLAALVALAGSSPADRVRRKALQLLATAVRDAAEDLGSWQAEQQSAEAAEAVAQAALAACQPAMAMLAAPQGRGAAAGWEPSSPLTKQTALAAVGSVAAAFGPQHPEQLLAVLPAVLAATCAEQAAVRGSALAATAALAAALGPRLVPQLPQTVAAVIAAVESAAGAVTKAVAEQQAEEEAEADAGASSDSSSGSESAGEDGTAQRRQRRGAAASGPGEGAALELAAALAAVAALVEHLGAFLAPHLPLLLGVLLHPAVLQVSREEVGGLMALPQPMQGTRR